MRKIALLLGAAVLATGIVASVAFANHPGPNSSGAISVTFVAGNPNCSAVEGANSSTKVDPGGNYADPYITITNYNGSTFDWAFTALGNQTYDMAAVIVKGGPNANIFAYDFASNPAFDDSDTGLHAPVNHNNNRFYGISHIQFCFDPKGGGDN